jgi:hypothetical protein
MSDKGNGLEIVLSGIDIDDIEMFMQEGGRGDGDFAASSQCSCNCAGCNSCALSDDEAL